MVAMGGGEWSSVRWRCRAWLPAGNGRGGGVDTRDPVLTLTRDREAAESASGKVGWCRLNGAQQQGGPSVEGGIW
jgi:hypothetical protein